MSDKLKKFIQQSKSKFDLEEPRPDLFDKIMEKSILANKADSKQKQTFRSNFKWMAMAASLALLIGSYLFFNQAGNKIENNKSQIAEKPIEQKQINVENADPVILEQSIIKEVKKQEENDRTINLKNNTSIQKEKKQLSPIAIQPLTSETDQRRDGQAVKQFNSNNSVEATAKQVNNQVAEATLATSQPSKDSTSATALEQQSKDQVATVIQTTIQPLSDSTSITMLSQPSNNLIPTIQQSNNLTIQQFNNSTIQQFSNSTIKQDKKPLSETKNSKTESLADKNSDESSSLKSTIRKGFFGFLSKNAKKWTGNTLSIKKDTSYEHPILAVHFKDDKFEFSKEFKLGNFGD